MTEVGRTQFKSDTSTLYPDNTSGEISPADLRAQMDNIADSSVFRGTSKITAPGATDDSAGNGGNGTFNVGDIWIDETNDSAYVCVDDTANAAVWDIISDPNLILKTGSPVANNLAVWNSTTEITGTGELTYSGGILKLTSNDSIIEFEDSDGTADNQRWRFIPDDTTFTFKALNDAGSASGRFLKVTRNNSQIESLDLTNSNFTVTSLVRNGLDFSLGNSTIKTTDFFNLILGVNNDDRLTIQNSGDIVLHGDGANNMSLDVGDSNLTSGSASVRIGDSRTGNGSSTMDLITDTTYSTFGLRISRGSGGANATTLINHRGTGDFNLLLQEAADFRLSTDNTERLRVSSTGAIGIGTTNTSNAFVTLASESPAIRYEDNSSGNIGYSVVNNSELEIGVDADTSVANSAIRFMVDGAEQMKIENDRINISSSVNAPFRVNTQGGTTYTLQLEDGNSVVIIINASANTVTIPAESSVNFPTGTELRVAQGGAGTTTVEADTGVNLNGTIGGSKDIEFQYGFVTLFKVGSDAWYLRGDYV